MMKKKRVIVVGGVEYMVLFDDLLPKVAENEKLRLNDDIAQSGVLIPVAVDENRGVIDGIGRLTAAAELGIKDVPLHVHYGLTEKEKRDLALKLNALRRQWTSEQRLDIAIALRKDKYSFRRIGSILNLSHETVRRYLGESGETEDFPETTVGEDGIERPAKGKKKPCISLNNAAETNKAFTALAGVDKQLKLPSTLMDSKTLLRKIPKPPLNKDEFSDIQIGQADLKLGDFLEKGAEIADESVDLVFTDPPYSKAALPLWDALGEFAQRILKPGGLLVSYSGNMFLPQIHQMLGGHLEYFWTFAVRHTGGNTFVRYVNVQQTYKPVIGYFKPPFNIQWEPFCDMVSGGRSKDNHEWEQPVMEARYYIQNLCPSGGVLCDPMMGSGTSVLAGLSIDMHCIGIDINTKAYQTAVNRVEALTKELPKKAA
jgi:hypothetical protein